MGLERFFRWRPLISRLSNVNSLRALFGYPSEPHEQNTLL
jgi:hypothetical protein